MRKLCFQGSLARWPHARLLTARGRSGTPRPLLAGQEPQAPTIVSGTALGRDLDSERLQTLLAKEDAKKDATQDRHFGGIWQVDIRALGQIVPKADAGPRTSPCRGRRSAEDASRNSRPVLIGCNARRHTNCTRTSACYRTTPFGDSWAASYAAPLCSVNRRPCRSSPEASECNGERHHDQ